LIDVDTAGKTSNSVAKGIKFLLGKIGLDKVSGITGAGTPESLCNSLSAENITDQNGTAESCGLHDCMSVF
jgi:hypothetical protein